MKISAQTQILLFATFSAFSSSQSEAGPYNFSDILPGDRAMGLGGAFAAVAEDSSALYYNPAGLAFATSSTISASVNALQIANRDYQKVFANKDSFYEKSQDIIPTFTGGVIDLTKFSESLHGAFSLQSLTQQSSNQNDIIRRPDIALEYYHRSAKAQTSELLFGAGAGKRVSPNLAVGVSLGMRQSIHDAQTYQDVSQEITLTKVKLKDSIAANKKLFTTLTINERGTASTLAAEVGGGILWAPHASLSFGIAAHTDLLFKQSLTIERDGISVYHYNDYSLPSAADFESASGVSASEAQDATDLYSNKTVSRVSSDSEPRLLRNKAAPSLIDRNGEVGIGRSRVRAGIASFPSSRLMLSADVVWHHSQLEWIETSTLTTKDVVNFHQGIEYFFSPYYFIREGLFTNFDARPDNLSAANLERIDYYGACLFFGTQTSDTQFSAGMIYQLGVGDALKISGQTSPTPVRENKYTVAFTAAHGL